ncbi:MAG: hypothetical protein IJ829_00110, partial [Kiritimatiellae bacterium]|nr:hypothetical protein [Kiritimatiellia bacterium]
PKLRFKALEADEAPHLQPGRAAQVLAGGSVLGWVGELHPLAVDAFEAEAPVVAFELDMEALMKATRPSRDYVDVPEFPPVSVDLALVVAEDVTNERLVQCITSAGGKLLEDVRLFDVYRDEQRVGAGKKSMAYALTFRAPDAGRFPCLGAAKEACRRSGCAPAVLAAADEWAVGAFLEGKIGYTGIARAVESALEAAPALACDSLDAVWEANDWTWKHLSR